MHQKTTGSHLSRLGTVTLQVLSQSWPAQTRHELGNKTALWRAFGYTPDKDVVRAAMTVSTLPFAVEQLTWDFVDMTNAGGKIAIIWDKTMATVPFTIGM